MYNNQRSKQIVERDYTIGNHQSGPNRFNAPKRGMVGEWLLNGSAVDSLNLNNGTDTSVSWVDAGVGYTKQAGSFNGSTSKIDMGNVLDETGGNAFSISIWYNPSSILVNQMLIGKQLSGGSFGGYMLWGAFNPTPNRYQINFSLVGNDGTFGRIELVTPVNELIVGNWYHLVATYNGSKTAAGTKIYIDTISKGTIVLNTLGTKSTSTTATFGIGSRNNGNLPTNGQLKLGRKYSGVITQSEIQTLFKEGLKLLH